MTLLGLLFVVVAGTALLALPRRYAALPLLAGCCYMTRGQGIEVAGLSFPVIRLLILAGILRVLFRGERPAGGLLGLDKVMLAWGAWTALAGIFHENPRAAVEGNLGWVYNLLGPYFLMRCFCQGVEDIRLLARMTAWMLVPVAMAMLMEHALRTNVFSLLGGVPEEPTVRNDRVRAQGPFAHAILAGTIGAVSIPLLAGLWRNHRTSALAGLTACSIMSVTCASSGPVLSGLVGVGALLLWRWREYTKQMRIAAVLAYFFLELVMKAPPYYLLARIDVVGGSTGWHRARLIESSIEHLSEWWFAGTDYTRHWMPTGVSWSPDHADITNHYIMMGVIGGLLSVALFIAQFWTSFRYIGEGVRSHAEVDRERAFLAWCVGACLLAHAATCVSVTYFDQSIVFVCVAFALAATIKASQMRCLEEPGREGETVPE